MGKGASRYLGKGLLKRSEKQETEVVCSFTEDNGQVSGVAISRAEIEAAERLLLESEEGHQLKVSSLEAVSVSGKKTGVYRFRAKC